jgi:hypothetical protein
MTAIILKFPPRSPPAVRIERERDGGGWLVVTQDREHGWLHGDRHTALADARDLARNFITGLSTYAPGTAP